MATRNRADRAREPCCKKGHDLANAGSEPLRAVAFFSGPALTQVFDNIMLPPHSHTLRSPNAGG